VSQVPKGCCGGGTCACKIIGPSGGRLTVSGSGAPDDPFILDTDVNIQGGGNAHFDTFIAGDGSIEDPWVVETDYAPTSRLTHIPDVNAPGPANGYVLGWNAATNKWVAQAPAVGATGAVLHDTSLTGDGSAGLPLAVAPIASRLLGTFPSGLGLSDNGMSAVVQHFASSAARTAAITAPVLNQLTMLDTNPGIIEYWSGSAWLPLANQTAWSVSNGQFLSLSGAYTAGSPLTILVKQLSVTTDASGAFEVLTTADLSGRAGVLMVNVQETGATPWKASPYGATDRVKSVAYRITDGTAMLGTPVTAMVQAILY
jgi:hypothetical protein